MKRHFRLVASAWCAAALLSACGGGTSSFEAFQPGRVLAFGDEISTLAPDGRKYALNALKADGSIDCESNPIWIQSVANLYGFRFAQCLGTATEAKAITRAAPGANVADVTAQIDAQVAAGVRDKDLALVLVGLNDVRQIYEGRAAGESEDLLLARARERGILAGLQVNRLVALGARVIVATAPDLGVTPYGRAKGTADAALLTRLSAAFNGRIRVTILNDGRFVGLVLADEMLQTAVAVPAAYGLTDAITPACRSTNALPNCNADAASLVEGASATAWLWADDLRFGTIGQLQLGNIAASRAQLNPF
jgi:outer membrane lipase/esterase